MQSESVSGRCDVRAAALEPTQPKKSLRQNGYGQVPTAPYRSAILLYPVMKVSCHFRQNVFGTFSGECVSQLMPDILTMTSGPIALCSNSCSSGRLGWRGFGWTRAGARFLKAVLTIKWIQLDSTGHMWALSLKAVLSVEWTRVDSGGLGWTSVLGAVVSVEWTRTDSESTPVHPSPLESTSPIDQLSK